MNATRTRLNRLNPACVRGMLETVLVTPTLSFRTIDPSADAEFCYGNYREAHRASFGNTTGCSPAANYLKWLRARVEEFPDGHMLAWSGGGCVGQVEVQVPYGLAAGYINLFYVTPAFRRRGIGRSLQAFVERYCRSWETAVVQLDVSRSNVGAVGFYRHLGYRFATFDGTDPRQRRMELRL